MHTPFRVTLLLILVILAASVLYLTGLAAVPFHPDESTQLYMSADLETLFTHPTALFYDAQKAGDLRQHYRLMDAPLPRMWIGLGRILAGQPALRSDWDWSRSWDENASQGALPTPGQLLAGRWMLALLFPFTLYFIFRLGQRLAGPTAAWSALLLTALNALVLLHTRRAMAEGLLLFTTTLSLWLLVSGKRPWLAAVPLALAFLSKQSAAALLIPAGLVLLTPLSSEPSPRARLRNTFLASAIFIALVLLFNPFLWAQPVEALQAALHERSAFVQAQVAAHAQAGGALLATHLPERLVGIIAQLYLTPPAVMDIANYQAELAPATSAYLSNPLHTLLRGFAGGGVLLLLTIFGLLAGSIRAVRHKHASDPAFWIFAIAGLAQTIMLLLVPVPFQRYSIALVPYTVLWIGMGAALIGKAVRKKETPV